MGSFSDYAENKIGDHVRGKTAFTMPATVALALVTVTPTDAMTGATVTEATYTGYARETVAGSGWNAMSSGSGTNNGAVTYPDCTAGSSAVVGVVACDSATIGAGNALFWDDFTSKTIDTANTPPTFADTAITLTVD